MKVVKWKTLTKYTGDTPVCVPTAKRTRINRSGARPGGIDKKRGIRNNETECSGEGSYQVAELILFKSALADLLGKRVMFFSEVG